MTVFLTFGVYALKINGDMPTQSEYIPLVSVYFLVATLYTLLSLMWFVMANYFVIKNHIPNLLVLIVQAVQCIKQKEEDKKKKDLSNQSTNKSPIETVNREATNNFKFKEDSEMRNRNSTNIQFLAKPTCNTCNKCEECDEIENKKKKNKNIFDKNLKTLNLIAFSIVFLIMVVSNLCIWIIVAT